MNAKHNWYCLFNDSFWRPTQHPFSVSIFTSIYPGFRYKWKASRKQLINCWQVNIKSERERKASRTLRLHRIDGDAWMFHVSKLTRTFCANEVTATQLNWCGFIKTQSIFIIWIRAFRLFGHSPPHSNNNYDFISHAITTWATFWM